MEKTKSQIKQINIGLGKRINASKEFQEQTRLRKSFERKLRGQMIVYFGKLYDKVADNYEMIEPYDQVLKDSQDNLYKILNSHYRVVIEKFGERQLRNYQKQNIFEEIYQDYVRQVGATRVVAIQNSTRNIIRRVINTNIGEGVEVIGKKIRDQGKPFNSFNRYRSNTIARTETHNAASYANHKVVESLNIPDVQKRWTTTLDPRSRTTHVQANGQTVGMEEDFVVGGRQMAYPGDPRGGAANVINCRCVLLYVTPEDIVTDDTTITPKPRQARDVAETIDFDISDRVDVVRRGKNLAKDYNEKLITGTPILLQQVMGKLSKPNKIINDRQKGYYNPSSKTISSNLDDVTLIHEYGHSIDHQLYIKEKGDNKIYAPFWSANTKEVKEAFAKDKEKLGFGLGLTESGRERNLFDTDWSTDKRLEWSAKRREKMEKFKKELFNEKTVIKTKTRGRKKGMQYKTKVQEYKLKHSGDLSDIVDAMTKGQFRDEFYVYGHGKGYYQSHPSTQYAETFANFFAVYEHEQSREWMKKNIPNTFRVFEKKMKDIARE